MVEFCETKKILFIHIGNTDAHEKMGESYLFDPD